MKRRWIIRNFFIAVLLLCVGAWAWSYLYLGGISYRRGQLLVFAANHGELWIRWVERGWGPDGVSVSYDPVPEDYAMSEKYIRSYPRTKYFLGFFTSKDMNSFTGRERQAGIPFWFVTSVLAIALIYVWRKTRPKPNPATAFPIETVKMPP
jgi:predicted small integral membrane protein